MWRGGEVITPVRAGEHAGDDSAPARVPAIKSLTVSPATATSSTASISSRSTAARIMSGNGRPLPASAGESTRSTIVCQVERVEDAVTSRWCEAQS